MHEVSNEVFISLFKEAFTKCFSAALHTSLSETECKHFSNRIFEETGLVIGAKSLKNYSAYVLHPEETKPEKPSVATLDTLARYVLNAPYTDEIKRKEKEGHYQYWFQYRNTIAAKHAGSIVTEKQDEPNPIHLKTKRKTIALTAAIILLIMLSAIFLFSTDNNKSFTDNFRTVSEDSLKANGWFVKSEDAAWWNRRGEMPLHLTLYTLQGDNWADSSHAPVISNLMLRKIGSECFLTEIHLDSFIPMHRWQQAGILLLEDTTLSGKSLRLSIAFNDFFGGYNKPKEIIVQGIYSDGSSTNNPEEIIHSSLFDLEPGKDLLVTSNLQKSALRIERNKQSFRFLYATGQAENIPFKEALTKNFAFHPKYIGIFALGGFVNNKDHIPAHFKSFSLIDKQCSE